MPWNDKHQHRRITFTLNLKDGKTWVDYNLETLRIRLNCDYMIAGKETAGTTGKKHFQGYMEFSKKKLGSAIQACFKKTFGHGTTLLASQGTCAQNQAYCRKEDATPFEFGEPVLEGQGTRTDLGALFQMVKDGADDMALINASANKWAVHRKALSEYRMLCTKKRSEPTKLVFLWGPTGTGKTMHAQELGDLCPIIWRAPFMTGLHGQPKNVLFDDFDWAKMDPKFWLQMCDRYPMSVEIKGGILNWAPEVIVFTSNDDPITWWPEAPEMTRSAIHRRMEEFGDIKFLGQLVPRSQTLLDRYMKLPPAASAIPSDPLPEGAAGGAAAASAAQEYDPLEEHDRELREDTQSVEIDSDDSCYEQALKRRRRTQSRMHT